MSKSRMTLHVYRISPDGTRTDLGTDEITTTEPYDGSRFLSDRPCRCPRHLADDDQADTAGEVA